MFTQSSPSLTSLESDGNTSFLRAARAGHLDKVLEHLKQNIDINTSNANGLNALHLASKDGHVEVVKELLSRGAAVDAATKKGNTALHIASLAGQEEVVKLLIQHGASVNVQSQNGFTPLYMAAQENHDNVVKYLLANGANQSLATEDGFTPLAVAMQQGHEKVVTVLLENDTRGKVRLPALHIAAKKDDVKAAKLLLENDHNPDVTSKSGFTPLHIASHYGNESIANLLIQKGADVNYAAKHNISPLHVAAKWGKSNMVALLLEKGANIEAKTRDGLTPLHCAARSGHEQVVDMLLEKGAPISSKTKNGLAPLHMAAQGDHVDAARILLYHRAPVDEVTVDYLTALHVAAHCGHVRVAKLLLDRGADANARALNGFTPLHIACKKNRIKVVELLLKHGASIEATTESGLTPLHVASFMGCMNIVIYLLQHNANPDVPTVRGETPLHLAARANQTDIIRILLRNGANVDARAREQQTPLHIASRLGNVDIVMLLLQHGAKVDTATKDMYTALHIASKEGQDEVAGILIDNGALVNATTKKGFTPLHLAAKHGHIKVAKLLLQKEALVDAQGKNGVTPLHVASHYDHQNVALLLLDKGASPHAAAKNGYASLHITATKNQMDIANTLLEYGAEPNIESKAGFTPLHLSAQEGHDDMSSLLIEHKANPNCQAKNGLTPLHLCAQEDRVPVAEVLVKNGANVDAQTKSGYTPLHIACHYGQINMVRFLLNNGASVKSTTNFGYTPLHQAAQQGHTLIVNILLKNKAHPNAVTVNGQTPLNIAQKLGYISVIETLKVVTETTITTTTVTTLEEKYKVVAPEAMQEMFLSDSEEEGGEDTVLADHAYRYLTADEMKSLGDDSLPIDVTRDEKVDSNKMASSADSNILPPQAIDESISPQHINQDFIDYARKYTPDNMDILRHPITAGFLVSFLVDARGGAMRGCRHSGVRVIVPPRCAASPTRITCRYVRPQRTPHPPPLMEGEALASRILELGPVGAKFLGPVIIEVPHFAALRGKEREIVILRSDNGETWREHTIDAAEDIMNDVLSKSFEEEDLSQLEDPASGRITRIVTNDFPQYFAVVTRIHQEVHAIGPEGGMVSSTVVPQVQAVFPQGALTKKIKVGLQAQPIDPELTAKLLGHGVAVSPVVTVEPRRRKFHKAITLSMPAPRAHSQGMINQYSGSAPTLRLLCSITGGTTRAQWEDVTGSTPLTFVNDCVSFTTTVSARFWLMDCRNIGDATKMATELYREAIHVPFMAKFVVFAKRVDPLEARLRVFCMTDDKEDKTLEHQEHFTEVAKSRDVEVLEGKPQYIEFAGNLVPITKSGEQLQFSFRAFRENRLPFSVRVKDQHAEAIGRCLFMREPKVAKGDPPQQPICILNIVLPDDIVADTISLTDIDSFKKSGFLHDEFEYYMPDPRISDMSNLLGEDWVPLAAKLGLTTSEINVIKSEYPDSVAKQAQSMLRMWRAQAGNKAHSNILESALKAIGRNDVIEHCLSMQQSIVQTKEEQVNKELYDRETTKRIEDEIIKVPAKIEDDYKKDENYESKYSAEEKAVDESDEEETFKKSVSERRYVIERKMSEGRTVPSTQRIEIVQEISSIKRQSLVEDKVAEVKEKQKVITEPYAPKVKSEDEFVKSDIMKEKTDRDLNEELLKKERAADKYLKDQEDTKLLEGVSQKLVTDEKISSICTNEDPYSPKLSKTPPPSPADFIIREKAAVVQEWDGEPQQAQCQSLEIQKGQQGLVFESTNENQQTILNHLPYIKTKTLEFIDHELTVSSQTVNENAFREVSKKIKSDEKLNENKTEQPDKRKSKRGLLGTLKMIVRKSSDSESEPENVTKAPKIDKKKVKDSKYSKKNLHGKKPRLPTPPPEVSTEETGSNEESDTVNRTSKIEVLEPEIHTNAQVSIDSDPVPKKEPIIEKVDIGSKEDYATDGEEKKSSFFNLFGKKEKKALPKIEDIESDNMKMIMEQTKSFMNIELTNYEDQKISFEPLVNRDIEVKVCKENEDNERKSQQTDAKNKDVLRSLEERNNGFFGLFGKKEKKEVDNQNVLKETSSKLLLPSKEEHLDEFAPKVLNTEVEVETMETLTQSFSDTNVSGEDLQQTKELVNENGQQNYNNKEYDFETLLERTRTFIDTEISYCLFQPTIIDKKGNAITKPKTELEDTHSSNSPSLENVKDHSEKGPSNHSQYLNKNGEQILPKKSGFLGLFTKKGKKEKSQSKFPSKHEKLVHELKSELSDEFIQCERQGSIKREILEEDLVKSAVTECEDSVKLDENGKGVAANIVRVIPENNTAMQFQQNQWKISEFEKSLEEGAKKQGKLKETEDIEKTIKAIELFLNTERTYENTWLIAEDNPEKQLTHMSPTQLENITQDFNITDESDLDPKVTRESEVEEESKGSLHELSTSNGLLEKKEEKETNQQVLENEVRNDENFTKITKSFLDSELATYEDKYQMKHDKVFIEPKSIKTRDEMIPSSKECETNSYDSLNTLHKEKIIYFKPHNIEVSSYEEPHNTEASLVTLNSEEKLRDLETNKEKIITQQENTSSADDNILEQDNLFNYPEGKEEINELSNFEELLAKTATFINTELINYDDWVPVILKSSIGQSVAEGASCAQSKLPSIEPETLKPTAENSETPAKQSVAAASSKEFYPEKVSEISRISEEKKGGFFNLFGKKTKKNGALHITDEKQDSESIRKYLDETKLFLNTEISFYDGSQVKDIQNDKKETSETKVIGAFTPKSVTFALDDIETKEQELAHIDETSQGIENAEDFKSEKEGQNEDISKNIIKNINQDNVSVKYKDDENKCEEVTTEELSKTTSEGKRNSFLGLFGKKEKKRRKSHEVLSNKDLEKAEVDIKCSLKGQVTSDQTSEMPSFEKQIDKKNIFMENYKIMDSSNDNVDQEELEEENKQIQPTDNNEKSSPSEYENNINATELFLERENRYYNNGVPETILLQHPIAGKEIKGKHGGILRRIGDKISGKSPNRKNKANQKPIEQDTRDESLEIQELEKDDTSIPKEETKEFDERKQTFIDKTGDFIGKIGNKIVRKTKDGYDKNSKQNDVNEEIDQSINKQEERTYQLPGHNTLKESRPIETSESEANNIDTRDSLKESKREADLGNGIKVAQETLYNKEKDVQEFCTNKQEIFMGTSDTKASTVISNLSDNDINTSLVTDETLANNQLNFDDIAKKYRKIKDRAIETKEDIQTMAQSFENIHKQLPECLPNKKISDISNISFDRQSNESELTQPVDQKLLKFQNENMFGVLTNANDNTEIAKELEIKTEKEDAGRSDAYTVSEEILIPNLKQLIREIDNPSKENKIENTEENIEKVTKVVGTPLEKLFENMDYTLTENTDTKSNSKDFIGTNIKELENEFRESKERAQTLEKDNGRLSECLSEETPHEVTLETSHAQNDIKSFSGLNKQNLESEMNDIKDSEYIRQTEMGEFFDIPRQVLEIASTQAENCKKYAKETEKIQREKGACEGLSSSQENSLGNNNVLESDVQDSIEHLTETYKHVSREMKEAQVNVQEKKQTLETEGKEVLENIIDKTEGIFEDISKVTSGGLNAEISSENFSDKRESGLENIKDKEDIQEIEEALNTTEKSSKNLPEKEKPLETFSGIISEEINVESNFKDTKSGETNAAHKIQQTFTDQYDILAENIIDDKTSLESLSSVTVEQLNDLVQAIKEDLETKIKATEKDISKQVQNVEESLQNSVSEVKEGTEGITDIVTLDKYEQIEHVTGKIERDLENQLCKSISTDQKSIVASDEGYTKTRLDKLMEEQHTLEESTNDLFESTLDLQKRDTNEMEQNQKSIENTENKGIENLESVNNPQIENKELQDQTNILEINYGILDKHEKMLLNVLSLPEMETAERTAEEIKLVADKSFASPARTDSFARTELEKHYLENVDIIQKDSEELQDQVNVNEIIFGVLDKYEEKLSNVLSLPEMETGERTTEEIKLMTNDSFASSPRTDSLGRIETENTEKHYLESVNSLEENSEELQNQINAHENIYKILDKHEEKLSAFSLPGEEATERITEENKLMTNKSFTISPPREDNLGTTEPSNEIQQRGTTLKKHVTAIDMEKKEKCERLHDVGLQFEEEFIKDLKPFQYVEDMTSHKLILNVCSPRDSGKSQYETIETAEKIQEGVTEIRKGDISNSETTHEKDGNKYTDFSKVDDLKFEIDDKISSIQENLAQLETNSTVSQISNENVSQFKVSKKKKPMFRLESEDEDIPESKDFDFSKYRDLETLHEKHIDLNEKEINIENRIIDKKLEDIDKALNSLEEIQTQTENNAKTEPKLHRVERKFERLASEVLDKEADEIERGIITTTEVENQREKEFNRFVSQISTEEMSLFQKEYSSLCNEEIESFLVDADSELSCNQEDYKGEPVEQLQDVAAAIPETSVYPSRGGEDKEDNESKTKRERSVQDQHKLSEEMEELLEAMKDASKK